MEFKSIEDRWRKMSDEVIEEIKVWRQAHPRATLKEIETTLDERLAGLRAQMLQDTALSSPARAWSDQAEAEQCPVCGTKLKGRGQHPRQLQTQGHQTVVLEREYGECPGCGTGLFPPG